MVPRRSKEQLTQTLIACKPPTPRPSKQNIPNNIPGHINLKFAQQPCVGNQNSEVFQGNTFCVYMPDNTLTLRLSGVIKAVSQKSQVTRVVDVGSGVGHLSR